MPGISSKKWKELTVPTLIVVEIEKEPEKVLEATSLKEVESKQDDKEVKKLTPPPYRPPILYTQRVLKAKRNE